jgi:aspartate racemase
MADHPDWKRVIGILGGLGPHAHVEFETLLLSATAEALGRAASDQDYPPWVLSSLPATPDRTGALLAGTESPVDAMVQSAERLASADFITIPCNSAHAFLGEVRPRISTPILDMIGATAERALDRVGSEGTIGILAVSGTLRSGLHRKKFREIAPSARILTLFDLDSGEELQERLVMEPIFGRRLGDGGRAGGGIKSGAFRDPARREELARPLREAARRLGDRGAEVVLTACTEIPLALGRESADGVPLLDPMAVLAERAIQIALGREALPA